MAHPSEGPQRVLVTGVSGFTGRYVAAELLDAGYTVHGTGQDPAGDDRVWMAEVDIRDASAMHELVQAVRPHRIVHLAAIPFVAHASVEAIYQVNVVGTRNLLSALSSLPERPRSVVLASSANVYGNASADPIAETTPLLPVNDYGISKLAMEHVARTFSDKLPIVVARPFNYTGIGQSAQFLLPKIVDHFRRRAPSIKLGNLDVSRDFSDVRHIAWAYRRLIETAPAGETFNICSGQACSLAEILQMMVEIAGYEIAVEVVPALVRDNELKRLRGDGGKLRAVVGEPNEIALRDTLRWMYQAQSLWPSLHGFHRHHPL